MIQLLPAQCGQAGAQQATTVSYASIMMYQPDRTRKAHRLPEKVAVYLMELWSLIEKPNNSPTYLKDFSHFRYTENLLYINRYLLI